MTALQTANALANLSFLFDGEDLQMAVTAITVAMSHEQVKRATAYLTDWNYHALVSVINRCGHKV